VAAARPSRRWAPDLHRGLGELRRVAHRQIVFAWDLTHRPELWLLEEYLSEIRELEHDRFTPLAEVADGLDARTVLSFPVPHDFTNGFQIAYWRRPEFYLDPVVRQASSTFAQLPASDVEPAITRLRDDLASGTWHRWHADLLSQQNTDYGYRLLIART
jgi:hypothetical protein